MTKKRHIASDKRTTARVMQLVQVDEMVDSMDASKGLVKFVVEPNWIMATTIAAKTFNDATLVKILYEFMNQYESSNCHKFAPKP